MSLLRDIQNAASSPNVRTADLLRMCKILAARLKSSELGQWVDRELNGYEEGESLPPYRMVSRLEARGTFVGPFGSKITNALIPTMNLPEYMQKWVKDVEFRAGITQYEDILSSITDADPRTSWPAEMIMLMQHEVGEIYEGYACLEAWSMMPRGVFLRILDAVRNKVLGFALDIEQENPEAGEADVNTVPVPPPVVQNVFNQHFYNQVGNVAAGSQDFKQLTKEQEENDHAKC